MPLFPPAHLRPARCSESLLISDRVAAGDLYSCRSGDSGCWFKRDFGRGSDATCCCRHGWTASRSNASGSCCPIRAAPRPSAGPRSSAPPRASPAACVCRPHRAPQSAPPRASVGPTARPSAPPSASVGSLCCRCAPALARLRGRPPLANRSRCSRSPAAESAPIHTDSAPPPPQQAPPPPARGPASASAPLASGGKEVSPLLSAAA